MLINIQLNSIEQKVPQIAIQFFSTFEDLTRNGLLSHKDIKPPDFPIDGLNNHPILSFFQHHLMRFWSQLSKFISWTKIKKEILRLIVSEGRYVLHEPPFL